MPLRRVRSSTPARFEKLKDWNRTSDRITTTQTMHEIRRRIPPAATFRALVNLRLVQGIDLSVGEGYTLTMKDGAEVEVSRRQARDLRERLAL